MQNQNLMPATLMAAHDKDLHPFLNLNATIITAISKLPLYRLQGDDRKFYSTEDLEAVFGKKEFKNIQSVVSTLLLTGDDRKLVSLHITK